MGQSLGITISGTKIIPVDRAQNSSVPVITIPNRTELNIDFAVSSIFEPIYSVSVCLYVSHVAEGTNKRRLYSQANQSDKSVILFVHDVLTAL